MPEDVSNRSTGAPLAYLITFTTYGTRLHGDERGSVARGRRHPGEPGVGLRPGLEIYESMRRTDAPMMLEAPGRRVVDEAIRETCTFHGWSLHAINVRTNHVHAVVGLNGKPEVAMSLMKARATTSLKANGLIEDGRRVWTRHGSTRYLWNERAVMDACVYVVERQGADITGRDVTP